MRKKPHIKLKNMPTTELAASGDRGRDITKPYVDKLAQPEDRILIERGGGHLKIYEEIHRDDQVFSTFQQRRTAVRHAEWDVTPASESTQDQAIAAFVKENLQNIKFDNMTDKMHFGIFYGYAVGEILWKRKGSQVLIDRIKVRRQRRFRFGPNGELYLLTQKNPTGEMMPADKFWVFSTGATHDDEPYGLGLAHYLYWPVYFKRNGLTFWLKFLERFGSPVAVAKSPNMNDKKLQEQILEALNSLRQDSAVVVPANFEIELLAATQSGTASHEGFEKAMDASIAKIVLSQTMTSEAVGGQYKAEVHKSVRDEVIKADADLELESFNEQVIPQLVDYNFANVTKYPKVWRNTEPPEDDVKKADRDTKIYGMGFEPTEEYIENTYGVGWVKRQSTTPPGLDPIEPGGSDFAETGRILRALIANRGDQQHIAQQSKLLASQFQEVLGERVEDLIAIAQDSGDWEDFSERLAELLAQGPSQQATQKVAQAGFWSRLLGTARGQSNAA